MSGNNWGKILWAAMIVCDLLVFAGLASLSQEALSAYLAWQLSFWQSAWFLCLVYMLFLGWAVWLTVEILLYLWVFAVLGCCCWLLIAVGKSLWCWTREGDAERVRERWQAQIAVGRQRALVDQARKAFLKTARKGAWVWLPKEVCVLETGAVEIFTFGRTLFLSEALLPLPSGSPWIHDPRPGNPVLVPLLAWESGRLSMGDSRLVWAVEGYQSLGLPSSVLFRTLWRCQRRLMFEPGEPVKTEPLWTQKDVIYERFFRDLLVVTTCWRRSFIR